MAAAPRPVDTGDRLTIGVLGTARITAEAVVLPARALGHRVLAVASRTPGRGEYFARWCQIPTVYDDYTALLADDRIDVVYIPVPNGLHTVWAAAALRAGKHVLVEKPLTADPRRARELAQVARRRGLVLAEAYHLFAAPVYDRLARLLTAGTLGTVRRVEADLVIAAPDAGDPRWSAPLGGGALNDLGCYGLAIATRFAPWWGRPHVVAAHSRRRAGVDDDTSVLVDLGGRARMRIRAALRSDLPPAQTLSVRGSAGTAVLTRALLPHLGGELAVTTAAGTAVHAVPAGSASTYTGQLAALAARIGGGAPLWSPNEQAAVAALLGAAHRAAGTGCATV